jgi:hypothetical protein
MPIQILYTSEPVGALSTFSGVVTGEAIIAHLTVLLECKECTFRLADLRAITDMQVSMPEMHKIALLECSVPEDYQLRKVAFVGDTVKYRWLIETYYFFVERWVGKRRRYESKTFDDLDEAVAWLGIKHLNIGKSRAVREN